MKKKLLFLFTMAMFYREDAQAQSYVIGAFAGGICSGVPANQMYLYRPNGLANDLQGNIYVALARGYVIKIATNGIVTKFAGTGSTATSGDGGLAVNAAIGSPYDLRADKFGNIYIAEMYENCIRKVDPNGIITTIAGNGTYGDTGEGGPAVNASLAGPGALAVDDAGNVYIGDVFNNKIKKVDANGIITTIAGTGVTGFSGDGGLANQAEISRVAALDVDAAGNIYFGDWMNNRIRKIDVNGIISTIAGNGAYGFSGEGGQAAAAVIGSVTGLDVDNTGSIYFTCGTGWGPTDQNRVLKINPSGIISTIAHSPNWGYTGDGGPAIAAQIAQPGAIISDVNGNNIYFIDYTNEVIRKVNSGNIISTFAGTKNGSYCGNGVPASNASLGKLTGIAIDAQDNVLFAEENRIRKIDAAGIVRDYAGNGINTVSNYFPTGDGGNALSASIYFDFLTLDQNGNVYGGDGKAIRIINSSGIINRYAGNYTVSGMAGGDGGLAINATLWGANDGFYDKKNNCLYISDATNNRIRKVDVNGIITTICGTGVAGHTGDGGLAVAAQIEKPGPVTADGNGNIYFSENYPNRGNIRKISANGVITNFAGTGVTGYSGDGGPATAAEIDVMSLATDNANNLYIAAGTRIRKITANGIINTIAGNSLAFSPEIDGVDALKSALIANKGIAVSNAGVVFFNNDSKIRKLTPVIVGVQDEKVNSSQLNVYPNPSQGYVSFKTNNIEANLQLLLFDVLGKQIETRTLNGFNNSFDFSALVNGVYSYSIMNKNQLVYSGKLIIAHEE